MLVVSSVRPTSENCRSAWSMENELPHSRYPCGISSVFAISRHFTTGYILEFCCRSCCIDPTLLADKDGLVVQQRLRREWRATRSRSLCRSGKTRIQERVNERWLIYAHTAVSIGKKQRFSTNCTYRHPAFTGPTQSQERKAVHQSLGLICASGRSIGANACSERRLIQDKQIGQTLSNPLRLASSIASKQLKVFEFNRKPSHHAEQV